PFLGGGFYPPGRAAILAKSFFPQGLAFPVNPFITLCLAGYNSTSGRRRWAKAGRRWSERYGADILDGLGSTEMLHIYLSSRPGDVRYGTTGKPVPGYDVRLIGDDGLPVPRGEMGELHVRGPTSAIMYWNNREQSRSTFLGEWTRSGDKYVEDEEGYFVYCGRRDDMLKVSGLYVSPFEVEGALQTHAEVLEAAVVAWPDGEGLVKARAFVVLKAHDRAGDALARELQEHVKTKLAPYKYPRWIEFRRELPKTATGKIQRFKLRAEAPAPPA
ncbi:MAG: AMP-binding protein, partial [Xanthobacteraceae bacterium]